MMTNHPPSEDLFAYRDGELDLEKRGLIEAHVVSCTACMSRLDEMSDVEGMLRQQHLEPGDAYFESLTKSVMLGVAPGTPERAVGHEAAPAAKPPRAAGTALDPEQARVRPGRRRTFEDEPRSRAPGLPWPAIISAVSAAATVVVVVVLLIQRQDAWRHAPPPEVVGLRKEAGQPAAEPSAPGTEAEAQDEAKKNDQLATRLDESGKAAPPSPLTSIAAGRAPAANPEGASKDEVPVPGLKSDLRNAPEESRAADRAEPEVKTQSAADAMPELAPSEFAPLAARYGLPTLYDPSRVSSDALLRAEPEIRILYQTGRSGADSARVRLYLAEAARARAGDSPDPDTFDMIIHHYRRAVELARDPDTAKMARKRLEDFVSRTAPSR